MEPHCGLSLRGDEINALPLLEPEPEPCQASFTTHPFRVTGIIRLFAIYTTVSVAIWLQAEKHLGRYDGLPVIAFMSVYPTMGR